MTHSCRQFRALLELVLEGGLEGSTANKLRGIPNGGSKYDVMERALAELSWHEHLLACADCRNLLQAEEALEILLATLPAPKLPEHLARRVVSRLRHARSADSRLDALLELDPAARAPKHLAESVLAGLRQARERGARKSLTEAELDRWLDLDRELHAPSGLAARVLENMRPERTLLRESVHPEHALPRESMHTEHALTRESMDKDRARLVEGAHSERARTGENVHAEHAPVRESAHLERGLAYESLRGESELTTADARRGPMSWLRSPWSYAAAAGILATLVGWSVWQRAQTPPRGVNENVAQSGAPGMPADQRSPRSGTDGSNDDSAGRDGQKLAQRDASAAPDAGILGALDVLEHWDFLRSDDVDVLLSSSIDPADEVLLEYQDVESPGPAPSDKQSEPPSKG